MNLIFFSFLWPFVALIVALAFLTRAPRRLLQVAREIFANIEIAKIESKKFEYGDHKMDDLQPIFKWRDKTKEILDRRAAIEHTRRKHGASEHLPPNDRYPAWPNGMCMGGAPDSTPCGCRGWVSNVPDRKAAVEHTKDKKLNPHTLPERPSGRCVVAEE